MNDRAFAIIRSGILEHLIRGDLGFFDLGVYTAIHLQANFSTGIWWGSAPKLLATAPRGTDVRRIQRSMENLCDIRFLRSFGKHGARGNYPVLINKYEVKIGALRGTRLNAFESVSWREPVYEACADNDADSDAEDAPIQDSESKSQGSRTFVVSVSSDAGAGPCENRSLGTVREPSGTVTAEPDGFVLFVDRYPRHRLGVRADVLREWQKIVSVEQHSIEILDGLERWNSSAEWREQAGRFVPKACNFLAARLWSVSPRGGTNSAEERTTNNLRAAGFAVG